MKPPIRIFIPIIAVAAVGVTLALVLRPGGPRDPASPETGWTVSRFPPGFLKIVDGFRRWHGKRQVAHLVYSDGLVAFSVFIEPVSGAQRITLAGSDKRGS